MPDTNQPQDQSLPPASAQDAWTFRLNRPIRRDGSARTMVIVLVSFIAAITVTRLFLSLTGYPQLGGGELHIAHVLWGGLLLFLAPLLLLLFSNRAVYATAAILTGVGFGLFFDEVGKFITASNDYFYPAAAPIIYIFFMLFLILVIRFQKQHKSTPRAEFSRAMETLLDWIDHPLQRGQQARMLQRFEYASQSPDPQLSGLAKGILQVVRSDVQPALVEPPAWWKKWQVFERWVTERSLRLGLAIGLLVMALVAFKNPVTELLGEKFPNFLGSSFFSAQYGQHYDSQAAPGLYQARLILEIILGALLILASVLLFYKKTRLGIPLAFGIVLLYLSTISVLLFYFEQFSTIAFVSFQFLLLLGLVIYRNRFLPSGTLAQE